MYDKELEALKRASRFRERKLYDERLVDLASNDYLGLAHKKKQLKRACKMLLEYEAIAPKASMLVNGYHPIHKRFENALCRYHGFEAGMVVGSGFLANLTLIEALVRKGDRLFVDEEYHASGQLAARLLEDRVVKFAHNNAEDLRQKLLKYPAKRAIVAIEGIYSMSGALAYKEIFEVANEAGALLIVDEAHSSGVLGKCLSGIFEYYNIKPNALHVKMGTLGKAYGSYGAYILASKPRISFLENRAKPIIYTTAPSLIDTALAFQNLRFIEKKAPTLRKKIDNRIALLRDFYPNQPHSPIGTIPMRSNEAALAMQQKLLEAGFVVGAIRQPTVKRAMLRLIARLGAKQAKIKEALEIIKSQKLQ